MTISVSQVSWGSYKTFEGPAYYGHIHYKPDHSPDFLEKAMLVTAATEGALNSVNMYDVAIMTTGCIQWADFAPQFSVCDMLGAVVNACGLDYLNSVLAPALKQSNSVFKQNSAGKWRFFLDGGSLEVNTRDLQHKLYHSCSGQKGAWDAVSKAYAKVWCAAMASVWDDPRAQQAQVDFTKPKLMSFVFGEGKELFTNTDQSGWAGAVKGAYISFAVNSPANAAKAVHTNNTTSKFSKWSLGWCLDLLHCLTFEGIGIWPARYNAIRPVLEAQFGVKLPVNAAELAKKGWASTGVFTPPPAAIVEPRPAINPPAPSPSMPDIVAPQIPIDAPSPTQPRDEDDNVPIRLNFWGQLFSVLLKLFGGSK